MTQAHNPLHEKVKQVAGLIQQARHVVAFTGAGISTPSGIPDFRSAGSGLWTRDDPMVVASLTTFKRRPSVFFNWLRPLAAQMMHAQPNPAHLALAQLEQMGILKAVVTQNIDGLHQKAGTQHVIELHGTAASFTCHTCRQTWPQEEFLDVFIQQQEVPTCPGCHNVVKPDIVLFEEMLPAAAWQEAENEFYSADLVLVAGSALEVSPANLLPYQATQGGAKAVIINLTPTFLDQHASVVIAHNVAEALPMIVSLLG